MNLLLPVPQGPNTPSTKGAPSCGSIKSRARVGAWLEKAPKASLLLGESFNKLLALDSAISNPPF